MTTLASQVDSVTRWLCQQLSLLLQQLLELVERHCRGERRHASLINEVVVLGTTMSQLQYWLPAEHVFRQPLQKLARLLPALLQTQEAPVLLRLLSHLYTVHQQLQPHPAIAAASHWLARKPATASLPPQLTQWLGWQQQADWLPAGCGVNKVAPVVPAAAVVDHCLPRLLRQLVNEWRCGQLTPIALAALCGKINALLQFAGNRSAQEVFSVLAQQLALVCVQPQLLTMDEQLRCWEGLWSLLEQQQVPLPSGLPCADIELLQAVQVDLGRYRPRIQHHVQRAQSGAAPLLPHDAVVMHYKLPWVLAAAGQDGLARLYHCWYEALLLHGKHRLPLSPPLLALLADTTTALNLQQWSLLPAGQIMQWHLRLLALWLLPPVSNVVEVALQPAAAVTMTVELSAIPTLLSRSFGKLSACRAEWFASAAALQCHRSALQAELLLLEKGAAAVKVYEVEVFCSLLLALHHKLGASPLQAFTSDLCWRSHQHLLALLDEAAAWEPPRLDVALIAAIKNRLQSSSGDSTPPMMLREPTPAAPLSATELAQRLRDFVETLALAVEQPLRFDIETGAALPQAALQCCENALVALLRLLVLEQATTIEQRRQALKPEATTIRAVLSGNEEGVWVEVYEDGIDEVSGQQTLKRLRSKLPEQVQRLVCRTVPGQGRHFRFLVEGEASRTAW